MAKEKLTESLSLHLPETLWRDILDAAAHQDRSASDFIRHILSGHLYGHKVQKESDRTGKD
jgi:hypothetical protein